MADARRRRRATHKLCIAGKVLAVVVALIWSLGPIVLIMRASLMPEGEIFAVGQQLFPHFTLDNYLNLPVDWAGFFRGLANSLIITTGATLLAVSVSVLAGYGYSRWQGRAFAASAFWLIALRLMPPIVLTLPLFPIINYFRISDTHFTMIVLYATFIVSVGTMVMRTTINQIPRELDEAALIDGATRWQIVRKVILPLCAPGMVAVAVFVIVYSWNEYLFAFIFTSKNAKTAPIVLNEMLSALNGTEWGEVFAATTLQLLPILIFVCLMKKYLVSGISTSAVKG